MTIIWRLPPSLKRNGFNGSCTPMVRSPKPMALSRYCRLTYTVAGSPLTVDAGHFHFRGPFLVFVEAAQVEPAADTQYSPTVWLGVSSPGSRGTMRLMASAA